jgi:hypothetical protein
MMIDFLLSWYMPAVLVYYTLRPVLIFVGGFLTCLLLVKVFL